MFHYIEIKDGKIISIGEASSMDFALQNTKGTVLEVTEKEHAMLSACRGDIQKGIFILHGLINKIANVEEL